MIIRVPFSCEVVVVADNKTVYYKLKVNDRLDFKDEIKELRFISVK